MFRVVLTLLIASVAHAHANVDTFADNVVDNLLKASLLNKVDLGMFAQKLCEEAQHEHKIFAETEGRIDHVPPARRLSAVRNVPAFCGTINARPLTNLRAGASSPSSALPASPRSKTIQHAYLPFGPEPALAAEVRPLIAEVRPIMEIAKADEEADPHCYDDGNLLAKSTLRNLAKDLKELEERTGFDIDVATVRKLEADDPQSYAEKVFGKIHGASGDKAGLLLIVGRNGEAALVGGDSFNAAIGEELIDSITADTVPLLAADEKYNEAVFTALKRLTAKLDGKEVPLGPQREVKPAETRTYKTKEEVDKNRKVTTTAVTVLLIISFVVPMLQYFGYTNRE